MRFLLFNIAAVAALAWLAIGPDPGWRQTAPPESAISTTDLAAAAPALRPAAAPHALPRPKARPALIPSAAHFPPERGGREKREMEAEPAASDPAPVVGEEPEESATMAERASEVAPSAAPQPRSQARSPSTAAAPHEPEPEPEPAPAPAVPGPAPQAIKPPPASAAETTLAVAPEHVLPVRDPRVLANRAAVLTDPPDAERDAVTESTPPAIAVANAEVAAERAASAPRNWSISPGQRDDLLRLAEEMEAFSWQLMGR